MEARVRHRSRSPCPLCGETLIALKASVGIVTRNGTKATPRAALSAATGSDDVIVVNNDCTPAHNAAMQSQLAGAARFIEFHKGMGLTKCWNSIIRAARHDWVVFSNDDVKFDTDWRETLERCLRECPKALYVGMAYPTNKYSCFAVHKSIIRLMGWFDERFTGYFMEDDDWHVRMSEASGVDVYDAWKAGRRDLIYALCKAALHDHKFRDPGSGGGLSKAANAKFFYQKWEACKDGWQMKGKAEKVRRKLPEVEWYPIPSLEGHAA